MNGYNGFSIGSESNFENDWGASNNKEDNAPAPTQAISSITETSNNTNTSQPATKIGRRQFVIGSGIAAAAAATTLIPTPVQAATSGGSATIESGPQDPPAAFSEWYEQNTTEYFSSAKEISNELSENFAKSIAPGQTPNSLPLLKNSLGVYLNDHIASGPINLADISSGQGDAFKTCSTFAAIAEKTVMPNLTADFLNDPNNVKIDPTTNSVSAITHEGAKSLLSKMIEEEKPDFDVMHTAVATGFMTEKNVSAEGWHQYIGSLNYIQKQAERLSILEPARNQNTSYQDSFNSDSETGITKAVDLVSHPKHFADGKSFYLRNELYEGDFRSLVNDVIHDRSRDIIPLDIPGTEPQIG